ncbi:dihydrofolate reductase family protein [Rubrobacter radiotolerans]|nr:dihydrofolate reductase family protein [Rubrobacter radiotolerans]MDX5895417.1 dihydrofolate reductase family protein [Rubrobacter radiotolerans]
MTFHLASGESARIFEESVQSAGAFVLGKRSFEAAGENPIFQKPSFVLSGEAREEVFKEGTKITFVTDGIESALDQAREAAGEKDVYLFGGANTVQQYLGAGLLDEIRLALVSVLLGEGIRLFESLGSESLELEKIGVINAPGVTHLSYRVVKENDRD